MKVCTFRFHFLNNGVEDETEFCADTWENAVALFNNWCKTDMHQETPFPCQKVEVVYNQHDAEEYEAMYGTPDEGY